jgi:lactate dehydrogenase-like 2-hydroxyacid dehydrogenase
MSKTEIIITRPLPLPVEDFERHFTVHRLWEADSPDGLIESVAARTRGLAWNGPGRLDAALMSRLPALEIVVNFGVGYDSVDVAEAHRRGVIVTNTPDVLTEDVADLAVGLMLSTVRRLPQADRYIRAGHWLEKSFSLTASLQNRRVGIIGLGKIGKAIARRCEAFNLEVLYHGRSAQPDVSYAYRDSPVALARDVDILILAMPATPQTQGLVDAQVLDALGPDGFLINVARGAVVDEDALVAALQSGGILGAGLDVFRTEPDVRKDLLAFDNVVVLPHIGSATGPTRRAMGQLMLDNLTQWFDGRGPITPVKETPWAPKAG